MNKIEFKTEYKKPLALALGFFDCIHRGHKSLLLSAVEGAKENNLESAVLTFSTDPSEILGGEKQIYALKERSVQIESLGIDNLIYTPFDRDFASLSASEFLNNLTTYLNPKIIFVGEDYTFGKRAEGKIDDLKTYCEKRDIEVKVLSFVTYHGKKISTSTLKSFVKSGNIDELNIQLSEPYFMLGEVMHGRQVGSKIGFPTANIVTNDDKLPLADGIYATRIFIDNDDYLSMTNIGGKPTFDITKRTVETYIFDFDGDIYGKTVRLNFLARTRDIKKFGSVDELKAQLKSDEENIRRAFSPTLYKRIGTLEE